MKTRLCFSPASERGYALMMVVFFATVSLVAMGGALVWTSSNARQIQRNNEYFATLAAAEAATEKVLANMSKDFQASGEATVYANMDSYRSMTPTTAENSYWNNYNFANAQGNSAKTFVSRVTAWGYTNLQSQYAGLNGMASTYRIVSNAKKTGSSSGFASSAAAGIRQEVQVSSIPLFQFAIFYAMDLEINPGPVMNITGRVHSNSTLYTQPQATLTYKNHVTSVGKIILGKSPLDPLVRTPGTVVFAAEHDSGVASINLPIGTNNSPAQVHKVVEIPPAGELASSLMGKQRYYNKADLVLIVSNTTVTATSGLANSFATTIPAAEYNTFLVTNATFFNKRENKTVVATQIDVAKLKNWSATNTSLRASLGRDVSSVYVADQRSFTAATESGVRLVNGATLPSLGLTVATPNPIYVQGHYNATGAAVGTTNTASTKPASLVGDAITILSTAWSDTNSALSIANRNAADTTVNAAFLSGIVQSNGPNYSGGVENFTRFLENWSNRTFTYNGSMVVMFPSQVATAFWGGSDVYSPPNRNWAFDVNFMDATKLPPGTPQALAIIRSSWAMVAPNDVN